MWAVTVYRDNGYSIESYTKHFKDEEDAEMFFSDEVKYEFDEEIETGTVSPQEIQNIVNSGIYIYHNDSYEVTITLEYGEQEELQNDYI